MPRYVVFKAAGQNAHLLVSPTGADNDFLVFAKEQGPNGNNLRIAIAVAGNNTALSVTKAGNDITINSATGGTGLPTSTANEIVALLNNSTITNPFVVAEIAPGNSGLTATAAVALTNLAGGTNTNVNTAETLTAIGSVEAGNDEDAIAALATSAVPHIALSEQQLKFKYAASGTSPFSREKLVPASW